MTAEVADSGAVIWDMDGVIADTGPYHFQAWHQVFCDRGMDFTEDDFRRKFGQRNDSIIRDTLGEPAAAEAITAIAGEKETVFRRLARHNLKPLPGAVELLWRLKGNGFKLALASSAPIENIQLVTGELGIGDCFQAIVTGRDVAEGKPSPQGFLLAAKKLGTTPGNCIVIEDAIAGIAAGKKAGMNCIAVTNTHPRESLQAADLIVDSLAEVTIDELLRLLNRAS